MDFPLPPQFPKKYEVGDVIVIMLPGSDPIMATYQTHDMGSITVKHAFIIGLHPDPQTRSIRMNMIPYGLPLMFERDIRKFALSTIIQTDVCADENLENAYRQRTSGIQKAPANAMERLNKLGQRG